MGKKILIKAGDKYGRLTIVNEIEPTYSYLNKMVRRFSCVCDCGNIWEGQLATLRNGRTKSCGCYHKEISKQTQLINLYKHGDASKKTKEYLIWKSMKQRCNNPNHKKWMDYGGRGIKVCKEWETSYENFIKDMGYKPSPEFSIDRINNNGNYEPSNCRWTTLSVQMKNRRPFKSKTQKQTQCHTQDEQKGKHYINKRK